MTVRPSPPMRDFDVSAILREVAEPGSGKSMFRRALKPQPREVFNRPFAVAEWAAPGVYVIVGSKVPHGGAASYTRNDDGTMGMSPLRYVVGDLLWCRETWKPHSLYAELPPRLIPQTKVFFAADGGYSPSNTPWRSSTQMPRWASRLTLEVLDVKIERLQSIGEEDARAESMTRDDDPFWRPSCFDPDSGGRPSYRNSFEYMWDQVHGSGSWSANPFVAAVTFRPHLVNVDLLRQREGGR